PQFALFSQHRSAIALATAAATSAVFAILLLVIKWKHRAIPAILALLVVEMLWFAHGVRPSFDSAGAINGEEISFLKAHPGDYRVLNQLNPDSAMSIRVPEFWGYDASVVRRYAEFVAWSQGKDPDRATQDVTFRWADPLYAMLRLR